MNKKAWCTCKVFLYCPVHWLHFNRGSKRLFSVEYLFSGEANIASIFLLLAEDYVKFIGRYYLTNSKNAWFLNFRMCLKFFKKSKMAAILNDVTAFRQRHLPLPRWGKVQPFPLYQGGVFNILLCVPGKKWEVLYSMEYLDTAYRVNKEVVTRPDMLMFF